MGLGCCCNRCSLTVVLNNYDNTSTVAGYPDTPTPPIEPYPRPNDTWNSGDECGDGNQPRCDAWPRGERPATISTNWNVYALGAGQTTRTQEIKGHKLIQSRKAFHGRLPFTFCPDTCDTLPSKYLSVAVTCDVNLTPGGTADPDGNWSSHYEGSFSVGRTSGIITGSGEASATVGTASDYDEENAKYFARTFAVSRTSCIDVDGTPTPQWDGATYTGLESPTSVRFAHFMARMAVDAANGYYPSVAAGDVDITINDLGATRLELELTWTPDVSSEFYNGGSSIYFYLLVELTSEYTAAMVETDAKVGTAAWEISNNYYLPWRDDGYRAKAPQSLYDEVPGAVDPDVAGFEGSIGLAEGMAPDGTYTDSNVQGGTLVGEPFTSGWPEWSFGFDHEVWRNLTTSPVIAYYGAFTDGTIIPHTATYWTTELFAGASESWPGYGYWYDESEGTLHVQKGQEAKPLLPSYNNFEPCGITRWLPDSGVYSDGATDNTSWTVVGFDGADPLFDGDITADLTAGMLLVFNLGPNDGEIYYITSFSYDGGTLQTKIVLGAQLVTDSTEWAALIARVQASHTARKWTLDQGAYGRASFLRFQYDRSGTQWPASRAIVGRVAVTASYNGGTGKTTFTTASATELITGDKVDILDSSNAAIGGASSLSVTWVSNTSFTVSGDKTAGAAFAKSSGAPYYGWNDDDSYGDFVVLTTESSVVDGVYTLTNTLTDDSKTGSCAILACTPDGDEPANSKAIAFPSRPAFTICGGRHWKQFITYCESPIWQDPISDFESFTACPDYVEPRTSARSGTRGGESCPTLPSHCVYPVSSSPIDGAGYDATLALTSPGAWMSSCLYP